MLPNNLADWPSAEAIRTRRRRRVVATVVGMIVLGGLIGFGLSNYGAAIEEAITNPGAALLPGSAPPPDDGTQLDQSLAQLLGNQPQSQNWAGYAATAGGYTAVSAGWTIPDLSLTSPPGIDAAWVGIGGVRSRDLIQAGTQRTVAGRGQMRQEAWVEILPRASVTVPLGLHPGDAIVVSITQQAPESWLIAFSNTTTGQSFRVTEHYASSLTSVEWIEEAPSGGRGRTLPLDDFGTLSFSQASAVQDDQIINIAQAGAHAITMITPNGQHLVEPSMLGQDGGSFSVTRTTIPTSSRRRS